MNEDCLKLTIYFGERARADGRFVADALAAIHARHELATSVVLRGAEGFGARHMRTDRLLTLSEDLPLVSVAVDSRPRIEAALRDVGALRFSGLVTLERARLLTGPAPAPPDLRGETKLTLYVGRGLRVAGRPAYRAIVELMHRHGLAGATVLLGVDGTAHGARQRARFFGANDRVPLMIIAVGDGDRIAGLLPELGALVPRPLITLERVRVCRRDGRTIADPTALPDNDATGLPVWQKLMVYAGEQSPHAGHPLSGQLVRDLRRAGAAGATSVRGIWGYHGDHRPHGDSFRRLRRRVPVVTVVVDTPRRIRDWYGIVAEMTDEAGLVTSEMVPAFRTVRSEEEPSRLRLAALGSDR